MGGEHRCLNAARFVGLKRRLQSTGGTEGTIVMNLEDVSVREEGGMVEGEELDSLEST